MGIANSIFQRTELLIGGRKMDQLRAKRVIIFGIGGVGSWCAESLIRSGIHYLTIVDSDRVSVTNINRQIMATTKTVGEVKTEVLKERLLEINPEAEIEALQMIYNKETHESFHLETFDFIIDAIDSFSNKIYLIQMATQTDAVLFSSMGAALKMDPTRIRVAEFWNVDGCPFGAALRKKIRQSKVPVGKKFMCVYSDEQLENQGEEIPILKESPVNLVRDANPSNLKDDNWSSKKAIINGTTSYIPAMFGMTIAGLVIQSVYKEE